MKFVVGWPTHRHAGDTAVMINQSNTATPGQCFTFWYYMYGVTMGNLILKQRVSGDDAILWKHIGTEGAYWRRALVTVKSPSDSFQVFNNNI